MRCQICPMYLPYWDHYRLHLNNCHETTLTVMCPDCGLEVERRNDLIRHMGSVHKNHRAPYVSYGMASKSFQSKWRDNRGRIDTRGLRLHRRQHGCRASRSREARKVEREERMPPREERKDVKKVAKRRQEERNGEDRGQEWGGNGRNGE